MKEYIHIENVHLSLNGLPFFQDINLKMKKGCIHSLSGKNGSGKSTLMSVLKGKQLKEKIELVPQRYDLFLADQFSFKENVSFMGFERFPSPYKRVRQNIFLPKFLERFEIDIHKEVRLLSGGQRQILSLLMAMQKNPELILLDEPTANLDAVNAKMLFEFLSLIISEKNFTCLMVCHDEELLSQYRTGSDFKISVLPCGTRRIERY